MSEDSFWPGPAGERELLIGCNALLQSLLEAEELPNWRVVDERLYDQLAVLGATDHDTMWTCRREYEIENDILKEALEDFVKKTFAPELANGLRQHSEGQLLYTRQPQLHIQREAYLLQMFAWVHFRTLRPE